MSCALCPVCPGPGTSPHASGGSNGKHPPVVFTGLEKWEVVEGCPGKNVIHQALAHSPDLYSAVSSFSPKQVSLIRKENPAPAQCLGLLTCEVVTASCLVLLELSSGLPGFSGGFCVSSQATRARLWGQTGRNQGPSLPLPSCLTSGKCF